MKSKIILLSGPRQVGKTTMVRQLLDSDSYHNYLKSATPVQIVYNLKHQKEKGPATMISVQDFLLKMNLRKRSMNPTLHVF